MTDDPKPLPFDAPTKPWAHQLAAVRFAEPKVAALWNMGMGSGKTRAALDLIRLRRHPRVLILAPLSVVPAWGVQAERHAPGAMTITILDEGTSIRRAKLASEALAKGTHDHPAVVVINYECAVSPVFQSAVVNQKVDLLICDECHKLKAPQGKQSKTIARYAKGVPYRLGLSGTPMPHSPMDAYGIFRTLDPTVFGTSFVYFRSKYAVMGGFQGRQVIAYQNKEEFARRIAPITFEVGRDVLDLPDATHVERTFALNPTSRKLYKSLRDDLIAEVDAGVITASNALTKLLRLSQVASGHVGLDLNPEEMDENGRMPERRVREVHRDKEILLRELLEEIPIDEPVVVFARFRFDLDQIARAAQSYGGSVELSGRRNELADWQAGGPGRRVLAAQIQSGAEGIDLTRARYCAFYSLDYSMGRYDQALARVHRPGQDRPVTYVHLIAEATVDRLVRRALDSRRLVVEDILAEIRRQK